MSKAVVQTTDVSLTGSVAPVMAWLDSLAGNLPDLKSKGGMKSAMEVLRKIEVLEVSAKAVKIHDIQVKAVSMKLTLMREIGKAMESVVNANVNDYDLDKRELFVYKRIALIPDYLWNAMELSKSSVVSVIRVYNNYQGLVELAVQLGVKNRDGMVKEWATNHLSVETARIRWQNEHRSKNDESWLDGDSDADLNDDAPKVKGVRVRKISEVPKYKMLASTIETEVGSIMGWLETTNYILASASGGMDVKDYGRIRSELLKIFAQVKGLKATIIACDADIKKKRGKK